MRTHTPPFIPRVLDPPKSPSSQAAHKALAPDGPWQQWAEGVGVGGLERDSTSKAYSLQIQFKGQYKM